MIPSPDMNTPTVFSLVVAIALIAPSCSEQPSPQDIAQSMITLTNDITNILESTNDTKSAAEAAEKIAEINSKAKKIEKSYAANKEAVDLELKKNAKGIMAASLKLLPALKKTINAQYYGNKKLKAELNIFTGK